MGIFNGYLDHPSEISTKQISLEYGAIFIEGEYLEKAYKVNNERFILTNKRVLLINKSRRGGKAEFISIPYSSIRKFSKECKSFLDTDAELKIWLKGDDVPIKKDFKHCDGVNEIYLILSRYTLK